MKKILLSPLYFLVYFFYWTFKIAFFCIKTTFSIIRQLFGKLNSKTIGSIEDVDAMEGHEFEFFSKKILERDGFSNVEVTRGSGDQGIDILAIRNGKKVGIQCKNYSGNVGNKAVQEAISGGIFYSLDQVYVLTNSYFTHSAKELAEKANVILLDRDYLLKKVSKTRKSPSFSNTNSIKEEYMPHPSIKWDEEIFINLPREDKLFLVWKELKSYSGDSPISHLQQIFRIDYMTAATLYDKYMEDPNDDHITID